MAQLCKVGGGRENGGREADTSSQQSDHERESPSSSSSPFSGLPCRRGMMMGEEVSLISCGRSEQPISIAKMCCKVFGRQERWRTHFLTKCALHLLLPQERYSEVRCSFPRKYFVPAPTFALQWKELERCRTPKKKKKRAVSNLASNMQFL